MRRDDTLKALHVERERFPERKDAIEAEIKRVEALPLDPLPKAAPTAQDVVAARAQAYLVGLRAELDRAQREPDGARRVAEIEAEIARIERVPADESPKVERAVRTPRSERAVAAPSTSASERS